MPEQSAGGPQVPLAVVVPFLAAALQGGAEGARGAAIVRSLQRAANLAARADLTSRRRRWGPSFTICCCSVPFWRITLCCERELMSTVTFAVCAADYSTLLLPSPGLGLRLNILPVTSRLLDTFQKAPLAAIQFCARTGPTIREDSYEGFDIPHQQLASFFLSGSAVSGFTVKP